MMEEGREAIRDAYKMLKEHYSALPEQLRDFQVELSNSSKPAKPSVLAVLKNLPSKLYSTSKDLKHIRWYGYELLLKGRSKKVNLVFP